MQVKNSSILHFNLKIILGTKHRDTGFSYFKIIKGILQSEVDFPVSKPYYTLIKILKVTENWKKQNFFLAKMFKFVNNVVSLCKVGVAKVVPGMRQIFLSFTNSCVLFYCCIWNNRSSPGVNEVLFPHSSTEIWNTNWESSKIFCDKVGTRHKKTQNLLQTVCRLIQSTAEQPYFR